jgi:hypothetical protein
MKYNFNNVVYRCYNTDSPDYQWYGGKGIRICDRWLDPTPVKTKGRPRKQGIINFIFDMGETWFPGATLDRLDSNKDYTPENCQWLSKRDNTIKMLSENGSHFSGGEVQRKLVREGTHHLLGEPHAEKQRKLITCQLHNFQKGAKSISEKSSQIQRKRVEKGEHNFMRPIKVSCIKCHREYDLGNFTRHIRSRCLQ